MENRELNNYVEKFGDFPYLPMMASYEDDIYQYLLSMALLRGTPLTNEEIDKEYNNKVDLVRKDNEMDKESEDSPMEENKIRKLLKQYGAEDNEIENFMRDLAEVKDDVEDEEEDDFNYLDEETMTKLKATEEGKDLIMNAPKMAKDELKKAIMDYLSK